MAITATTLAGAVKASDTVINVASATGITAPNFQTAAGITALLIDQEMFLVMGVSGTFISVLRGQFGSQAVAHVVNTNVQIGLLSDFPVQQEQFSPIRTSILTAAALIQPAIFLAGLTDAIPAHVPGFYVVKTSSAPDVMTLAAPTAADEGNIVEVWSDTTQAHTITATSLVAAGVALKTTITFPAFRGAGVRLRASNLVWHLLSGGGSATNGGPVVLT